MREAEKAKTTYGPRPRKPSMTFLVAFAPGALTIFQSVPLPLFYKKHMALDYSLNA